VGIASNRNHGERIFLSPMIETAIIGAGPYGLSIAAHLRTRGISFRIFGRPMDSWVGHMPKGMMLVIGMWSMMLASGTSPVKTLFVGSTTSELGAIPMVHIIIAPMQTCIAI